MALARAFFMTDEGTEHVIICIWAARIFDIGTCTLFSKFAQFSGTCNYM